MIPLTMILRKAKVGYEFKGRQQKVNHLLFMDDLKLYGKDESQVSSLIDTVYAFSADIRMEFGLKKCGVLVLKRGKVKRMDGLVLPSGEVMKQIDDEGYKYLGILEIDKVMEEEMKNKFKNEYLRRLRLVLKSKLNGRNKVEAINTWAVSLLRYGAGVIMWTVEELKTLDRKTRKLLTRYGALHPRSDIDRLYVPRKRGGRGLISCEYCVRAEENNVAWYIKNATEPLLLEVRGSGLVGIEDCKDKTQYKRLKATETENRWTEKRMYGQFYRDIEEKTDTEKRWLWMTKSDLKPETEALICAAQEQALRTNYIKHRIDHTAESDKCRICGEKGETVWHITSQCTPLAQKEYKRRHDNVGRLVHWELCGKYGLDRGERWYQHEPEGIIENANAKILWDFMIQCDHEVEHRKPDIVVIEKDSKQCWIIDIACPGDNRVCDKEEKKIDRYDKLAWEVKRLWTMKKVVVIPIIVGALGTVSQDIEKYIAQIGVAIRVEQLQKTALLGTARILRRVLEK